MIIYINYKLGYIGQENSIGEMLYYCFHFQYYHRHTILKEVLLRNIN